MTKSIEVIALIYKSTQYLDFIYKQMNSDSFKAEGWDVAIGIVANDATEEVLSRLGELDISYSLYNDPDPDDYYLNRVYRCWNYAGKTSRYDNICFINSDMMFSEGWLDNLLKHHDGTQIPCSRLVESGKMTSGTHGVTYDCGKHPNDIDKEKWLKYAEDIKEDVIKGGGLFMPCIFEKKRFVESGMYPEGNIYAEGEGKVQSQFVMSGDQSLFNTLRDKYGMKHITVFDSVVYHIQEGEMDE